MFNSMIHSSGLSNKYINNITLQPAWMLSSYDLTANTVTVWSLPYKNNIQAPVIASTATRTSGQSCPNQRNLLIHLVNPPRHRTRLETHLPSTATTTPKTHRPPTPPTRWDNHSRIPSKTLRFGRLPWLPARRLRRPNRWPLASANSQYRLLPPSTAGWKSPSS